VALLAVFELGVARTGSLWHAVPRSKTGVFHALETEVVRTRDAAPRVLILGNSRVRDAIDPSALELQWNLGDDAVLNLGLTAGTPTDSCKLYERNREYLRGASLAIVNVDDWNLSDGSATDTDRQFADLGTRLREFDGPERQRLLVGWAWRTYDLRNVMRQGVEEWALRGGTRVAPIGADGMVQWRQKDEETGPEEFDPNPDANKGYASFRPHEFQLEQLKVLVRRLQQDGSTVVIVRLPTRQEYEDAASTRFAEAYRYCRETIDSLTQSIPGVVVMDFTGGTSLGIPPNHFYDYGHVTLAGRRTTTRLIADKIAARMPDVVTRAALR